MGKRNFNKYKKKRYNQTTQQKDSSTIEDTANASSLKDVQTILNSINNNDVSTREHIATLLSSYQFDENDKAMLSIVQNKIFTQALVSLLNDNFYQVRYQTVSAIMNIITSFDDCSIETTMLMETEFISYSVQIIKDFINFDKKTSEHVRIIRTLLSLLDLYMLIFDLWNDEIELKVDFTPFIASMIELILNHKELLNEELYMKLVKVIGCFFSVKDVLLNQNDEKILFIIDMLCKEINSEGNNELKQSINVFCLFYICCNYYSKNNSNNQTIMNIIDKVNTIVSNENTFTKINEMLTELDNEIINIVTESKKEENKKEDEDMNTTTNQNSTVNKENDLDEILTNKINTIDNMLNALINYFKIFEEITEALPFTNDTPKNNDTPINDEDYEEIEEDDEDNNINKMQININVGNVDENIKKVLLPILSVNNYTPVTTMLNQKLMELLSKYCSLNFKTNQFYINTTDKMLNIPDNVSEIKQTAISILNNIILKTPSLFNQTYIESLLSFLISNIQLFINNITGTSSTLFSLYIMTLKNVITKFTYLKTFPDSLYTCLLTLIDNSKDSFIKCSVIDAFALIAEKSAKWDICEELKKFLYKESDIEVLCHIVNAFMDIYSGDVQVSDGYLKNSGVVQMMKDSYGEFKKRMKEYKHNIGNGNDEEGYDYIKETFVNMKRFVKYKEKHF